ncbi:DUF6602 domain-containing protein [Bacillus sp. CH30_1T]|uniref:DUF6602 domain-containing protein n=1 Tax=Bacillus sp. CH30_1T TaxID=2604836 RepID=UPI0037C0C900
MLNVSSQCDVIIYNEKNTILKEDHPFFNIETVVAIGEVKSTLNTNELKTLLLCIAFGNLFI